MNDNAALPNWIDFALKDRRADVRQAGVRALDISLGNNKHLDAADVLAKATEDCDAEVRRLAVRCLRKLVPDVAANALKAVAARLDDTSVEVRREAMGTLGWLGELAAGEIPALANVAVKSEDITLRGAALKALAAVDPKGITAAGELHKIADSVAIARAIEELKQLGVDGRELRRAVEEFSAKTAQETANGSATKPPEQATKANATASSQAPPPSSSPQSRDGPTAPSHITWKGKIYLIRPMSYRLLAVVWGQANTPIAQVLPRVWKASELATSQQKIKRRLASALNRLNDDLLKQSVPLRFHRKNEYITKETL